MVFYDIIHGCKPTFTSTAERILEIIDSKTQERINTAVKQQNRLTALQCQLQQTISALSDAEQIGSFYKLIVSLRVELDLALVRCLYAKKLQYRSGKDAATEEYFDARQSVFFFEIYMQDYGKSLMTNCHESL